jgi:predicted CXXCH cytochrome family protein
MFLKSRGVSFSKKSSIVRFLSGLFIFICCISLASWPTHAAEPPGIDAMTNDACMSCHGNPDLTLSFTSGETMNLAVNIDTYNHSIHGRLGFYCTACHTDITSFPHPPVNANTAREFSLKMFPRCSECHEDNYRETQGSVHRVALDSGNLDAAECVDCHGSHDISLEDQDRYSTPELCRKCHSEIYDYYASSVHGSALINERNPDVPSCTDCHGIHHIVGPTNENFRLFSNQICGKCHDDSVMMNRYGINPHVTETYLADFHGKTILLEQKVRPAVNSEKATCVDCHGVHDILGPSDPKSTVANANLLTTCRKCHPGATENFTSAWMAHQFVTRQKTPIVYWISGIYYKLLLPGILGGMAIFVFLDYMRQVINKLRGRRNA